jgi:NAD(P)H-hydrate epimerase
MDPKLLAWHRMQQTVLSTEQVRSIDRLAVERYGMHSLVLMENAAIGCAHWLRTRFAEPMTTVLLCGRGNNGGDGLALARHLTNWGWPCRVYLLGGSQQLSKDAGHNLEILTGNHGLPVETIEPNEGRLPELVGAGVIVDALLGTGARGNPRAPLDRWIEAANASSAFRVAVDVPTGVDAETGQPGQPTFLPDATLTFVARKPAMAHLDSSQLFGEIAVLPIGVPAQLLLSVLDQTC